MLLESLFYGIIALALIFVCCECVQRFTNAFDDIDDVLLQLHWYRYPVEIQRMLIPITIYLQKPVVIAFFGSIGASREQFQKVNA